MHLIIIDSCLPPADPFVILLESYSFTETKEYQMSLIWDTYENDALLTVLRLHWYIRKHHKKLYQQVS